MAKKRIRVVETTVAVHLVDESELEGIDLDDEEALLGYVENSLIDVDIAKCEEYAVTDREATLDD